MLSINQRPGLDLKESLSKVRTPCWHSQHLFEINIVILFLFSAETQIAAVIHGSLALYFGFMGPHFLNFHQWYICFLNFSFVPFFTKASCFSNSKQGASTILL